MEVTSRDGTAKSVDRKQLKKLPFAIAFILEKDHTKNEETISNIVRALYSEKMLFVSRLITRYKRWSETPEEVLGV